MKANQPFLYEGGRRFDDLKELSPSFLSYNLSLTF